MRQAYGAAGLGALHGVTTAQTGVGVSHAIQSAIRGDKKGVVAGAAAALISRHTAGRINRKIGTLDPRGQKIARISSHVTAIALGIHSNPKARATIKYGLQGAAHGFRKPTITYPQGVGSGPHSPSTYWARRSQMAAGKEYTSKGKDGMTGKPIIQIAMEMKKHLSLKRAGKPVPETKPLRASFQLPVKRHKPVPPAPPAGPSTVMHVHNHFGPRPKDAMKKAGVVKHPVKRSVAKKEAKMNCPECGEPIPVGSKTCKKCGAVFTTKQVAAQSFVFKEGDNYRWVLLSSNGYRDRDGELISTKALERDVALWDLEGGPEQPLRWWHVALTKDYSRGLEVGTTDFRMVSGHTLIESGTFIDPLVGEAVFKNQDTLAASVGFRHSQNQPNADKIFDAVNIFERSLLPKGKQSNVLVELMVN